MKNHRKASPYANPTGRPPHVFGIRFYDHRGRPLRVRAVTAGYVRYAGYGTWACGTWA